MPELPEVEEVRRTLEPHILGRKILSATAVRPDFLTPQDAPLSQLTGQKFSQTLRHGKKLFCVAKDSQTLLFHLGMSGRIDAVRHTAPTQPHTHFVIRLQPATPKITPLKPDEIRFRDPRRFGGVWYYPSLHAALAAEVHDHLGPDALTLKTSDLAHWKITRGSVKARLLAQRDVAGLGNIYVDESLWMSQLHPLQRVHRITPAQLTALVKAIHEVLHRSIKSGGTTLRDYRNASDESGAFQRQLQAYGRGGKACLRCSTCLRTTLVAGRTTVHCPACQRRR